MGLYTKNYAFRTFHTRAPALNTSHYHTMTTIETDAFQREIEKATEYWNERLSAGTIDIDELQRRLNLHKESLSVAQNQFLLGLLLGLLYRRFTLQRQPTKNTFTGRSRGVTKKPPTFPRR